MSKQFIRRNSSKFSKLGRKRKNKQVWKRPTGRDNKMREKRKGYPARVSIGYKTNSSTRNKLNGKMPVIVKNLGDLEMIKVNQIAIIANIGKKKKLEIAKKAKEMKVEIYNMNAKTFLKKNKKKAKGKKVEGPKEDKKETKKEVKPEDQNEPKEEKGTG